MNKDLYASVCMTSIEKSYKSENTSGYYYGLRIDAFFTEQFAFPLGSGGMGEFRVVPGAIWAEGHKRYP